MRKMAYVCSVKSVEDIEGKDRIKYIHLNENGYGIIGSNSFTVGEKVVYIEVDSILPQKDCFEFLRKRCFKENLGGFLIKNMKMAGLYSNGILFHFDELPLKKKDYPIGVDLTKELNIRKYEPEDDASPVENKLPKWKKNLKSLLMRHAFTRPLGELLFVHIKVKAPFPTWLLEKSDEDNIQNNPEWFEKFKNDECYITRKQEGQSVTYLVNPKTKKFEVYARNVEGEICHVEHGKSLGLDKFLLEEFKKYKTAFAIQGEFCAPTVQKGLYQNGTNFYVFTVKNISENRYLSWQEIKNFCKRAGIMTVPEVVLGESAGFEKGFGAHFENLEAIQEWTEHQWFRVATNPVEFFDDREVDFVPKKGEFHRAEGIVVRALNQSWSFKVKSNEYQLEGL